MKVFLFSICKVYAFFTSLQERLLNESKGALNTSLLKSNSGVSVTSDVAISKTLSSAGTETSEPPVPLPSQILSVPMSIKKVSSQEKGKTDQKQIADVDSVVEIRDTEKAKNDGNVNSLGVKMAGEVLTEQSQRPSNPFLKSSNNQEPVKKADMNQVKSQRPSNPFKKSPK